MPLISQWIMNKHKDHYQWFEKVEWIVSTVQAVVDLGLNPH